MEPAFLLLPVNKWPIENNRISINCVIFAIYQLNSNLLTG